MRTLTLTFICLTAINNLSFSQSTNGSGANVYFTNRFLGWDASNLTNPLTIRTNNITRMHINGIATGFGVSTSGFIGIGTTLPASPLHIQESGNQTAVGWYIPFGLKTVEFLETN